MASNVIILSNTLVILNPVMILERDPERMDKVTLFIPGMPPHFFEGSDAHELWRYFDNEQPGWKSD